MNFNANFFLTRLMSAATSASAHRCLPPNLVQRASSEHRGRHRARAICFYLSYGGCFGRKKTTHQKNRERRLQGLRWPLFFLFLSNNQPRCFLRTCAGGVANSCSLQRYGRVGGHGRGVPLPERVSIFHDFFTLKFSSV
jgi:hypothetical protein